MHVRDAVARVELHEQVLRPRAGGVIAKPRVEGFAHGVAEHDEGEHGER